MTSSFARKLLLKTLAGLRHGSLKLIDGAETYQFGDPQSDLRASIAVHDERFFSRVLYGGEDGAGDAYMAGLWSSPDLVSVIRLAIRNLSHLQKGNSAMSWLSRLVHRLRHLRRANSLEGSRRNIHEHYDLSNEFFRLFLDENMVYSSAVFDTPGTTLADAQIEKIDRLCRKLSLERGDQVLEIGTGWGAFALHAAGRYGCRVTTTTISRRQFEYSRELFAKSGEPGSRITLLLEDYRHLKGRFDHIVSIEMFEAVGLEHYDDFFGACDRLLTADGSMAMQTITMNERQFAAYHKSSDWIQRRIFPGSELASICEILGSLARSTGMSLVGLEDIGMHYAQTLAEWRRRFLARTGAVRQLGFDEPFLRMWDYYLAYCEGGFRERYVSDVQLVLSRTGRVPPGRACPAPRRVTTAT
ncbi:Cyclopropane-fatty-acyl-phospholipid synthase [Candidatus Sulfopaludibacter sp. SbA4]|nr:Cyclopropane-fatty-acyl-phospholipid synthase [Candidatus Sulfopaludibacter sp. SbA4]